MYKTWAYVLICALLAFLLVAANGPILLPMTDEGRYSRSGIQYDANRTSCANAATTTLEANPNGNVPAVFGFGALITLGSDARVGFTVTTRGTDVTLGDQTTENAFLATSAGVNPDGRASGSPIYASEKHDLVVELGQIRNKPYLYSGRYCSARLAATDVPGGVRLFPPCLIDTDCTGNGANQFNLAGTTCTTVAVRCAASAANFGFNHDCTDSELLDWEQFYGGVTVRVRNDTGAAALVDWDLKR